MPICIGNSDFLETFKQLKNFRNALIHAKISDSLLAASFIEQGFFYTKPITKQKEDAFPDHKIYLDGESVINFNKKVDSLIENSSSIGVNSFIMTKRRIRSLSLTNSPVSQPTSPYPSQPRRCVPFFQEMELDSYCHAC